MTKFNFEELQSIDPAISAIAFDVRDGKLTIEDAKKLLNRLADDGPPGWKPIKVQVGCKYQTAVGGLKARIYATDGHSDACKQVAHGAVLLVGRGWRSVEFMLNGRSLIAGGMNLVEIEDESQDN